VQRARKVFKEPPEIPAHKAFKVSREMTALRVFKEIPDRKVSKAFRVSKVSRATQVATPTET